MQGGRTEFPHSLAWSSLTSLLDPQPHRNPPASSSLGELEPAMKRALRVIGILVALLIVIAVALPFLIDANQFRPRLEQELTKVLGRDVQLGDLKLSLFSGGVTA